jgi:hypothetical protein
MNINGYIEIKSFHLKGDMPMDMDVCISCGKELSKFERNRCECWECMDTTTEAYTEDD